jgi:hypothetical protein
MNKGRRRGRVVCWAAALPTAPKTEIKKKNRFCITISKVLRVIEIEITLQPKPATEIG